MMTSANTQGHLSESVLVHNPGRQDSCGWGGGGGEGVESTHLEHISVGSDHRTKITASYEAVRLGSS